MFGLSVGPYLIVVGAPVHSFIRSFCVVVHLSCMIDPHSSHTIISHLVLWHASDPPVKLLMLFQPCALMFIYSAASWIGSSEW
jgi:hypothetical protein